MSLELLFAEKLKEKLELKGIKCVVEESKKPYCRKVSVVCEYKPGWRLYYEALKEVARELGGVLDREVECERDYWLEFRFGERLLVVYPQLTWSDCMEFEVYCV